MNLRPSGPEPGVRLTSIVPDKSETSTSETSKLGRGADPASVNDRPVIESSSQVASSRCVRKVSLARAAVFSTPRLPDRGPRAVFSFGKVHKLTVERSLDAPFLLHAVSANARQV